MSPRSATQNAVETVAENVGLRALARLLQIIVPIVLVGMFAWLGTIRGEVTEHETEIALLMREDAARERIMSEHRSDIMALQQRALAVEVARSRTDADIQNLLQAMQEIRETLRRIEESNGRRSQLTPQQSVAASDNRQ